MLKIAIGTASLGVWRFPAAFRKIFFALRIKHVSLALRLYPSVLLLCVFLLSGRAIALKGKVIHHRHHQKGETHGGQQPVAGSHVYMFAINTAGYGSAPISLLQGSGVTLDSNGNGYVITDADGAFNLSGLYASYCPTPGSSVYLQSLGGDPGDGQDNSAIDLVTALPLTCSQQPNAPSVAIDERTTVAAAWTLIRYASLSPLGFSASPSNPQALLNAIAYSNNMVSGYDGTLSNTVYSGSLTVPSATINTMASILAECVNDGSSSSACTQLFGYATPVGGTAPTDVLQAAINVALNPANNVANLFSLVPSTGGVFQPTLTLAPSTWNITYGTAGNSVQGNSITIDHTKVANSDQINFPILVSNPAAHALATIANGGFVQSPNGYDILFSSDAAGQNLLDFEIDNYNPANGASAFWVRIPNLSHTTDTVIYMWYSIPNISNSLENALGVWSNNYLSVYHLGDGTTVGAMDSGIAGYNLSGSATPVTGEVGGAAYFSGDPTVSLYHDYVNAYPSGSEPVTMEVWEQEWSSVGFAVGYGNASADALFALHMVYGTLYADDYSIGLYGGSLPASGWHQLVDVYGGGPLNSATDGVYIDGVLQSSYVVTGVPHIGTEEFKIGGLPTTTAGYALSGSMDEVRISAGTRSADWIATEYANQSSPSTFLTIQPLNSAPPLAASTATLLDLTPQSTLVGSTVTLGISVANATNSPATGSVACNIGTQPAVSLTLLQGSATTTFVPGISGTIPISCIFAPNGPFLPSSGSATETVLPNVQPVTVSIASSEPQATYGDSVVFTATVNPTGTGSVAPTGTVTFYNNNILIGQAQLPSLQFATTSLPPGSSLITAQYSGDGNFGSAASQSIRQGVSAPPAACPVP